MPDYDRFNDQVPPITPEEAIPSPQGLRQKFLNAQDGEVQNAIRAVNKYLSEKYKYKQTMSPPFPKDYAVAKIVADKFRAKGWQVELYDSQKDGSGWTFVDPGV